VAPAVPVNVLVKKKPNEYTVWLILLCVVSIWGMNNGKFKMSNIINYLY
jgi:hypothetical protein